MERFENGSDIVRCCKQHEQDSIESVEAMKLTVWKVMIERVTVVKFRMNGGGGNGAGCFEVKLWVDTSKFTDMIVARFRKCSDLVREGKVFVKYKTK